ncbi:transposase [Streptomyces phaeochromogenes]|nr:transposase [Streptomyces phaeochromogenes]
MSLEPRVDHGVPELTARVVRAAFPKGTMPVRIREALGPLFEDEAFAGAFAVRGRPAVSPGMLALVSVLQYAEGLTDRQAADQVRARIDWKFLLGLELDDPGFEASVLSLFRSRLIEHGLEQTTLELVAGTPARAGPAEGRWPAADRFHACAGGGADAEQDGVRRRDAGGRTGGAGGRGPAWLSGLVTAEWAERYGRAWTTTASPGVKRSVNSGLSRSDGTGSSCWRRSTPPLLPTGCARSRRCMSCGSPGSSSTTATRGGCAGGRARTSRRFITGCARPMTPMPVTGSSTARAGPATRRI